MNKRFLPILITLLVIGFVFAFQTIGRDDNPKSKNEKILRSVGLLLEEGHYQPKKIDDKFSKSVLKSFLKELDEDKTIFLQRDIDSFKKYENYIDDEIHGAKLESFYFITESYTRRLNEVSGLYRELLSSPFDFSKEENVVMDGEKLNYLSSESARKDLWRKRLKFLTLSRYYDMLEDREKNSKKAKDSKDTVAKEAFVFKADSTLERESRDQVRKQIERYFTTLKNHNKSDELFSVFVNAIAVEMDPHTTYFAPIDTRGFNETMSGKFYGIGAQLKEEDSKIKIASLIAGGPAWKSNALSVNDEIIKIAQAKGDAVDVTGYSVQDAVKLIRGSESGTEVRLTIKKIDGSVKVITLLRDEIKLDETFAKSAIVNQNGKKIGYIFLPEFYMDFENPNGAKCSEDVAKEVEKLKKANVDGIVLDLRTNGGGSLTEVVKMVGLFIEDGPVVQVKSRDASQPQQLKDRDKSVLYNGPLAVMVDEFSASASEIFAAAIQDYKRGIVIGSSSTYGKGTVQRSIPLNPESQFQFSKGDEEDLGSIKLTLQKFYRINGGTTQLQGVKPDVVIPDRYELVKAREKDNPTALSWDEIAKADYKIWNKPYSDELIVGEARQQINSSMVFSSIKKQIEWIDKQNDKDYPLNLTKYQAEQKSLKAAYQQLDSLYKLKKELDVINSGNELITFKEDSSKMEKNKQFLNRLKTDIYLDESIKIIRNMIAHDSPATKTIGPAKKD